MKTLAALAVLAALASPAAAQSPFLSQSELYYPRFANQQLASPNGTGAWQGYTTRNGNQTNSQYFGPGGQTVLCDTQYSGNQVFTTCH